MNTETIIEEAQSSVKFDVLSFIEATAYPTQEVVVFQDVKSADEYVKLVNERVENDKAADGGDSELDAKLTARISELAAKISKSSIIFELRGMPPGIVNDILRVPKDETEDQTEAGDRARDNELIARTIIGAKNADGVRDDHLWEKADIEKLRGFLKEGEFSKLLKGVSEVNFNAMVFDQATDAGFSGRRADVAA